MSITVTGTTHLYCLIALPELIKLPINVFSWKQPSRIYVPTSPAKCLLFAFCPVHVPGVYGITKETGDLSSTKPYKA
jgi:hypothetical protein